MEKVKWTSTNVVKLFKSNIKSKQSLFNAEKRGEIPESYRISRGTTKVRTWDISQIPAIGEKFGFIKKPKKQQVVCVYTAKGGVLKTNLAFNLARTYALNGIKTLIIGLDIQCSITDICIPKVEAKCLDDWVEHYGLYDFLYDKKTIESIIHCTDLPTLDIIPETPAINYLEKKIRDEKRREYVIKDRILKKIPEYDLIIFDNSPSWNMLIENAKRISKL